MADDHSEYKPVPHSAGLFPSPHQRRHHRPQMCIRDSSWSGQHELQVSYGSVQLIDDVITLHLPPEEIAYLQRKPSYPEEVRMDLIGDLDDIQFATYDVLFIAESKDYDFRIPLHTHSLANYERINEEVLLVFSAIVFDKGRMKTVVVNNENMANMLSGICEDLKIPLRIEDFITNLSLIHI